MSEEKEATTTKVRSIKAFGYLRELGLIKKEATTVAPLLEIFKDIFIHQKTVINQREKRLKLNT